jgi:hypothetical protein
LGLTTPPALARQYSVLPKLRKPIRHQRRILLDRRALLVRSVLVLCAIAKWGPKNCSPLGRNTLVQIL